jgi:hypothetical protein
MSDRHLLFYYNYKNSQTLSYSDYAPHKIRLVHLVAIELDQRNSPVKCNRISAEFLSEIPCAKLAQQLVLKFYGKIGSART